MGDYDLAIYIMVFAIFISIIGISWKLNDNNNTCPDCPTVKNVLDGSAKEIRGIRIGNLNQCIHEFPEGYNHNIYSVVNQTKLEQYRATYNITDNPSVIGFLLNPTAKQQNQIQYMDFYCSVTFWSSDLQKPYN